jgi:hypothetical protein
VIRREAFRGGEQVLVRLIMLEPISVHITVTPGEFCRLQPRSGAHEADEKNPLLDVLNLAEERSPLATAHA